MDQVSVKPSVQCGFTLGHYAIICAAVSSAGYRSIFFHEDEGACGIERVAILRHDVDQSLEQALQIAKIEPSFGLKSTFFVWLTSPFYNVLEPSQSAIVRELVELGHEIGLHFDETAYQLKTDEDLTRAVYREAEVLSSLLELRVRAVSWHRPSQRLLGNDLRLQGLANTYQTRFLSEYKYLSDSRRVWREGCPCTTIAARIFPRLHLLMHPFWWTPKEAPSVDHRGRQFLREKGRVLDDQLRRNISTYHGRRG